MKPIHPCYETMPECRREYYDDMFQNGNNAKSKALCDNVRTLEEFYANKGEDHK